MRLSDLQYDLPPELIAQQPAERRDAARLLVLDRATGQVAHRIFREIGELLAPGDCLVLNDTRVVPARFHCRRASGGRIEALFLHAEAGAWQVLLRPSARLSVGELLACEGAAVRLCLDERGERGAWRVHPVPPTEPLELVEQIGHTPLPPYIHRVENAPSGQERADRERYQTVYARQPGAVAAPTAGLHFTPVLLDELAGRGVRRAEVTLHVGAGTFQPITSEDLAEHRMHAEWFSVSAAAATVLNEARAAGGRIVAVGTTSARVLESLPAAQPTGAAGFVAAGGWTDIFIYPPHRFRNVDRLITNFHLPGSTLLAMVMAFASPALIRAAYAAAIAKRYRFYSFGDAMIIL